MVATAPATNHKETGMQTETQAPHERHESKTGGSSIHVERTYPHARAKVWRALAEPALLSKWLMAAEGYAPVVGTKFVLRPIDGKAKGWRGFVECVVLAVDDGRMLQFSWEGDAGKVQTVTFTLFDDVATGGTRLVLDHDGFHGPGGFVLAKLVLAPGWRNKILVRLADALASL